MAAPSRLFPTFTISFPAYIWGCPICPIRVQKIGCLPRWIGCSADGRTHRSTPAKKTQLGQKTRLPASPRGEAPAKRVKRGASQSPHPQETHSSVTWRVTHGRPCEEHPTWVKDTSSSFPLGGSSREAGDEGGKPGSSSSRNTFICNLADDSWPSLRRKPNLGKKHVFQLPPGGSSREAGDEGAQARLLILKKHIHLSLGGRLMAAPAKKTQLGQKTRLPASPLQGPLAREAIKRFRLRRNGTARIENSRRATVRKLPRSG